MNAGRWLAPVLCVVLSGCATHYELEYGEDPFGFISGIWHGIIFPLSLLVNLLSWMAGLFGFSFLESIQIVGRPNTGFWYYCGFAIGIFGVGGGSSAR